MELSENQAFLILNALPDVGPITLRRLMEAFGENPLRILGASTKELEAVKGVGPKISGNLQNWSTLVDLHREEERMAQAGVDFVTMRDPAFPALLREMADCPIGLYRKGNYAGDRPSVAIVGSRRTTLYGQAVAAKLGAGLARAGYCVVSGLARGIDSAAHKGAVDVQGVTCAVLGTGIDIIYPPENLELYRKIEECGAIYSEFPFGRRADRQSFAMRNRIVAGMCQGIVVVESDVSGGSMITAKFAGEQGRQVFAVPGRIDQATSAGCHQLIRDGAVLVTSVEDIIDELSYLGAPRQGVLNFVEASEPRPLPQWTGDEAKVMGCLSGGAILSLDDLAALSGLDVSQLMPLLLMLELKRAVAKRSDGRFEAR